MSKGIPTAALIIGCMLFAPGLTSGQTQHEISVVSIEVPVRVYAADLFLDDLTIEDFELLENGIPQEIDALYHTKKTRVLRREEYKDYSPATERHFFLLFQTIDYSPRLAGAFDLFFSQVLVPSDTLTVMTPMHNYKLSAQALQSKPGDKLSKELQGMVRKDTQTGSATYRTLLSELKRIVRTIASSAGGSIMTGLDNEGSAQTSGLDFMLPRYRGTLEKMESLRVFDEKRFLGFASSLKQLAGQKYVFFFYQREFRPEIQARVINNLITMNQDKPNVQGDLMDLMNFYRRDNRIDLDRMQKAYADSGVFFNFIFMNKEPDNISGIHMQEQSEDIFETMTKIADATGGFVDTSQNPAHAFEKGCRKAEEYYILYYTPKAYRADGEFKNIVVNVKRSVDKLKVSCRTGYYAR